MAREKINALEGEVKSKEADIAVLLESAKTIVQEKNAEIEKVKQFANQNMQAKDLMAGDSERYTQILLLCSISFFFC